MDTCGIKTTGQPSPCVHLETPLTPVGYGERDRQTDRQVPQKGKSGSSHE